MEFEVAAVPRSVWVHESLGVAKRVEHNAESLDLLGQFRFLVGVAGKPEYLVDKELDTRGLARAGDTSEK